MEAPWSSSRAVLNPLELVKVRALLMPSSSQTSLRVHFTALQYLGILFGIWRGEVQGACGALGFDVGHPANMIRVSHERLGIELGVGIDSDQLES